MKRTILIFTAVALLAFTLGCASRSANTSSDRSYPAGPTVAATESNRLIPAGTQLAIRTNERIETRDASASDRSFDAELASDVVNDRGEVLIPRGSDAELSVFRAGDNDLVLGVRSVEVNGRRYMVDSADLTREGGGNLGVNRETAKNVGGGALLGTLVGAVAGGAKGAAVGAAVGAAGGAAVQVLTKGDRVEVPAETVLTFRLDEPLRLNEFGRQTGSTDY